VPLIYRQGEKLKTHEKGDMEKAVLAEGHHNRRKTVEQVLQRSKNPFKLKGTNLKQKASGETNCRKNRRRSRGVRRSATTLRLCGMCTATVHFLLQYIYNTY